MTPSVIATGAKVADAVGEERDGEAQQTVGAGLQEQPREDNAAGGRRLGMSIGQPSMKWYDGQLHGEGDEEAEHEPHLHRRAEVVLATAK